MVTYGMVAISVPFSMLLSPKLWYGMRELILVE
jgi:hypothetical protein